MTETQECLYDVKPNSHRNQCFVSKSDQQQMHKGEEQNMANSDSVWIIASYTQQSAG